MVKTETQLHNILYTHIQAGYENLCELLQLYNTVFSTTLLKIILIK